MKGQPVRRTGKTAPSAWSRFRIATSFYFSRRQECQPLGWTATRMIVARRMLVPRVRQRLEFKSPFLITLAVRWSRRIPAATLGPLKRAARIVLPHNHAVAIARGSPPWAHDICRTNLSTAANTTGWRIAGYRHTFAKHLGRPRLLLAGTVRTVRSRRSFDPARRAVRSRPAERKRPGRRRSACSPVPAVHCPNEQQNRNERPCRPDNDSDSWRVCPHEPCQPYALGLSQAGSRYSPAGWPLSVNNHLDRKKTFCPRRMGTVLMQGGLTWSVR